MINSTSGISTQATDNIKPDVIYILVNEAMPGLIKIGRTAEGIRNRIAQLNQATGVPLPFECHYAAEVLDGPRIEKMLHTLFSEYRVNHKREFFRLSPEKAVVALQIGAFKEVTPGDDEIQVDQDDKKALESAKSRKSNLRLSSIGIQVGDVLVFSRDESITAKVVPNNKIAYGGEILSLSAAALRVLQSMGYRTPAASGPAYWMFDGELLYERRDRLENEQFSSDRKEIE